MNCIDINFHFLSLCLCVYWQVLPLACWCLQPPETYFKHQCKIQIKMHITENLIVLVSINPRIFFYYFIINFRIFCFTYQVCLLKIFVCRNKVQCILCVNTIGKMFQLELFHVSKISTSLKCLSCIEYLWLCGKYKNFTNIFCIYKKF